MNFRTAFLLAYFFVFIYAIDCIKFLILEQIEFEDDP